MFESIITDNLTLSTYCICLAVSCLCGIICAFAVSFKNYCSKSFLISLVILPMIVHTVITMVNGNVGTGVAVMGAFSLVRFRSLPGKAKDISALFLVMSAGLTCATGYVGIAILFTFIVSLVLILFNQISFETKTMDLVITIPETLNFVNCFDDIFKEYFKNVRLVKTKTTNMGSLYKCTYKVEIKDKNNIQECIDKLRCRNGNLEIMMMESMDEGEL